MVAKVMKRKYLKAKEIYNDLKCLKKLARVFTKKTLLKYEHFTCHFQFVTQFVTNWAGHSTAYYADWTLKLNGTIIYKKASMQIGTLVPCRNK